MPRDLDSYIKYCLLATPLSRLDLLFFKKDLYPPHWQVVIEELVNKDDEVEP